MKLPNILQLEEMQEEIKKAAEYRDKTDEEKKKYNNQLMKVVKKSMGLSSSKLSVWEEDLLMYHAQDVVTKVMWATPVGKL